MKTFLDMVWGMHRSCAEQGSPRCPPRVLHPPPHTRVHRLARTRCCPSLHPTRLPPRALSPCALLQVFTSGTDELLELCKATYELHGELGMRCTGQPPKVPSPAQHTAVWLLCGVALNLHSHSTLFYSTILCGRSPCTACTHIFKCPAVPSICAPASCCLQPWDGKSPCLPMPTPTAAMCPSSRIACSPGMERTRTRAATTTP